MPIAFGRPWIAAALLALGYFAGAELGHGLSFEDAGQVFATFWPANGLLLAALYLSRRQRWPALLLAAAVANLASDVLFHEKSLTVGLGFCVAHLTEASLGAWLLSRAVKPPFTLDRTRNVARLAMLAAVVGPMVGASLGSAVVSLAYGTPYWSAWRVWGLADLLGILAAAPVVLAWAGAHASELNDMGPRDLAERLAVFSGLLMMTQAVYGDWLGRWALPILILPFLIWIAWRFRPRTLAVALFLVFSIAVWNVGRGRGPYTIGTNVASEQRLRVQGFMAVASVCFLGLAALVAERRAAERENVVLVGQLEHALAEVRTLRGLIPICAWCHKIRNDTGFWQQMEVYVSARTHAEFTHSICPECLEKLPEFVRE
jgi:integral membrane sensor domain MASE1